MSKIVLTTEAGRHFDLDSGQIEIGRFSGGEVSLRIKENLSESDVYIVGSTNAPAENLLELCLAIDTASRKNVNSITAIIPYFAYARADKEKLYGEAVSAEVIAKMIQSLTSGNLNICTIEIHSSYAAGFFKVPFKSLDVSELFVPKFSSISDLTILAPDAGAVQKAGEFAQKLGIKTVSILHKERGEDGRISITGIEGGIGKKVLITDDIVDSGGTILMACDFLKSHGAEEIYVAATHTVWPGGGYQKLVDLPQVKKFYTTNTVKPPEELSEKIEVLDVSPILKKEIFS